MSMKKKLAMILALSIACSVLFAGLSIKAFDFQNLYKEHQANPSQITTDFQLLLSDRGLMDSVLVLVNRQDGHAYPNQTEALSDYDKVYDYYKFTDEPATVFARARMGGGMSLARVSIDTPFLSPLQLDLNITGGLSIYYNYEDPMRIIGIDGQYFYGAEASLGSLIAMRAGWYHTSTHYGDWMLYRLTSDPVYNARCNSDESDPEHIYGLERYLRMNDFQVGLEIKPLDSLRLYAELNWAPRKMMGMDPWPIIPEYAQNDSNASVAESSSNGMTRPAYSDAYKAFVLSTGAEWTWPNKLGKLIAAYDLHLYQDGQTGYQVGYYDPSNPWDISHSIIVKQTFEKVTNANIGLVAGLHTGRFPFTMAFGQKCNYLAFGLSFNR